MYFIFTLNIWQIVLKNKVKLLEPNSEEKIPVKFKQKKGGNKDRSLFTFFNPDKTIDSICLSGEKPNRLQWFVNEVHAFKNESSY